MYHIIMKYVFVSVLFICISNFGYAQSYPIYKQHSAIAVLDQDSLFSQSEWGKRVLKSVEDKVSKLSYENRIRESELRIRRILILLKFEKQFQKLNLMY